MLSLKIKEEKIRNEKTKLKNSSEFIRTLSLLPGHLTPSNISTTATTSKISNDQQRSATLPQANRFSPDSILLSKILKIFR